MASPAWIRPLINKTFGQRFLLSRLTRWPVLGGFLDRWLFQGDDIFFLPADRTLPVLRDLPDPQSTVLPSQVVEHFIRQANHLWIMDFCICRDSTGCRDYPVELGCLFLGEAALDINPAFGRPVSREEALAHVRKCREAGLVHLIGRNKLDTVWLDVGPGRKLLTVCNCCPCCCLWRILPHVAPEIGAKVHRMPGVSVSVTDACVGCGACSNGVCFVDAIEVAGGRARIRETCRGCGRCVEVCPERAIEIRLDDPEGVSRTIDRLARLVDLT